MTAAVIRQRRRRERLRGGLIQLTITVPEVQLIETLVEARLLSPLVDHDRHAIEQAAERLLAMISERD